MKLMPNTILKWEALCVRLDGIKGKRVMSKTKFTQQERILILQIDMRKELDLVKSSVFGWILSKDWREKIAALKLENDMVTE